MSKYTNVLDDSVIKYLTELEYPKPFRVMTYELIQGVARVWERMGYNRIEVTPKKVGRAMARLKHEPYRNSSARGWIVK
jgi:hypothetical protein